MKTCILALSLFSSLVLSRCVEADTKQPVATTSVGATVDTVPADGERLLVPLTILLTGDDTMTSEEIDALIQEQFQGFKAAEPTARLGSTTYYRSGDTTRIVIPVYVRTP